MGWLLNLAISFHPYLSLDFTDFIVFCQDESRGGEQPPTIVDVWSVVYIIE